MTVGAKDKGLLKVSHKWTKIKVVESKRFYCSNFPCIELDFCLDILLDEGKS